MMPLHLLYLNDYYQNDLADPASLLARYSSMTDLCEALTLIDGIRVSVIQRFTCEEQFSRNGVDYHFIKDNYAANLLPWQVPKQILKAVRDMRPDVVHTGGKPVLLPMIRRTVPQSTAIVWQHHGGGFPSLWLRWLYRRGFRHVDAFFFTTREQSEPLKDHSLIDSQRVFEILEGSTILSPLPYEQAKKALGIKATPTFLWVGHLNANKDPLTVIKGFAHSLEQIPNAELFLAYGSGDLLPQVKSFIMNNNLTDKIHLLGTLSKNDLQKWYSASDYFVLGSHSEGSGYALLEAIACGTTPIVTNIPSFRRITACGRFGSLWIPEDPDSLRRAIGNIINQPTDRESIKSYFENTLSFPAIALTAFNAYTTVRKKRLELLNQ